MSALRLPKEWNTFSFQKKQFYLVDTHQAANISEASRLLSARTDRSIKKKLRETFKPRAIEMRFPYAD